MGDMVEVPRAWAAAPVAAGLLATPQGRRVLSCIQCGVCAGTCPYGEVMDHTPRRLIGLLRAGLLEEAFASNSLLNCVACYACSAKCPRDIQLTEVLLPVVKEQVLMHLPEVPGDLRRALDNTLRYGNPMGQSARKRADWIKDAGVPVPVIADGHRPVDVLWFVECYPAYTPRGQEGSLATARLFHALGVDFAILANEEKCAGECARLAGEAGLFGTLADYNIANFKKYRFGRLVTGDPHAYDAFLYQYPALGFSTEVAHTVPFLAQHLNRLRPLLTRRLDAVVTYHDSCGLGRHNGYYDEPRALLAAIPGVRLVEMAHNRLNTVCCGGGGGGMWLDAYYRVRGYERLSERRVQEAVATGADVLAVSCPYEIARFEDALKVLGYEKRMVVRDVVELLAEALAA
jgi:Fe-S oxidoreductase